ncbi:Uncharacterized protein Rs2_12115 [Raphanus sativus]|nr:Uncharacterized protein Rs2_12115 [Raphanus sativus]
MERTADSLRTPLRRGSRRPIHRSRRCRSGGENHVRRRNNRVGRGLRSRGAAETASPASPRDGRSVEASRRERTDLVASRRFPPLPRRRGLLRRELPLHGVAEGLGAAWDRRSGPKAAHGEEVPGGFRIRGEEEKEAIAEAIRHMYSPDLKAGWGIHIVQEEKLLAKKDERESLDSAVEELMQIGMQRETAAESIYRERCLPVNDGPSWAKYMSISGSSEDEHDIITLQYTEDGLLSVDENRQGHAAAFGDDIAIECLATEFKREIYVVQAHGSDGMVDEENCVFFLPHKPRSEIIESPLFLFMKGTGWCGGGADHYEPLIANASPMISHEKVALVL